MTYYDEHSLAQKIILKPQLSNREKNIKYFVLAVRYLIDNGESIQSIEKNIKKMIVSSFEYMSDKFVDSMYDKALELAKGREPLSVTTIKISKKELNFISSLHNDDLEKIAFVMLCLYKANEYKPFMASKRFILSESKLNKNSDDFYKLLNMLEVGGVFKCNVYQGDIYYEAGEKLIEACDDDNPYVSITDKKNIIYYYLLFVNKGRFIICRDCGCIEKVKSNSRLPKYCLDCAADRAKERHKKYNKKRNTTT